MIPTQRSMFSYQMMAGEGADTLIASTWERRLPSSTEHRERLEDQRSGSFGAKLRDHTVCGIYH